VTHFVHPERELAMSEPSLRRLSTAARRTLFDRLAALMEMKPMVCFGQNLFGDRVWFLTVLMPVDAGMLERLHRMDYRYLETERLQQAVDLAASMGCAAVALGGYTSILSRDGTAVMPPQGVHVTSGNTLTAVAGALRITRACRRVGIDPRDPQTRVGIVGATGNIGSSLVSRLVSGPEAFRRVLLVGRRQERLAALEAALAAQLDGVETTTATELAALSSCNVIAIATNTNEPLIYPDHLPGGRRVVIADVSVPGAVSSHVRGLPQVTLIPLAGTVTVPGEPDFSISSHTAPGTAFCCAAEAMLMGLEPELTRELRLTGAIDAESMSVMSELGRRHGFLEDLGEGGFKVGA